MEIINRINTVIFQREKNSKWEIGLQFNNGDLGVIDNIGNRVKGLWDIRDWNGLEINTNIFQEFDQT